MARALRQRKRRPAPSAGAWRRRAPGSAALAAAGSAAPGTPFPPRRAPGARGPPPQGSAMPLAPGQEEEHIGRPPFGGRLAARAGPAAAGLALAGGGGRRAGAPSPPPLVVRGGGPTRRPAYELLPARALSTVLTPGPRARPPKGARARPQRPKLRPPSARRRSSTREAPHRATNPSGRLEARRANPRTSPRARQSIVAAAAMPAPRQDARASARA
jgi:hypothetical protein